MKSLEELAQEYQDMLREKFPDIVICLDPDTMGEFPGGMFAAYGIPDDREDEYDRYVYGQFPSLLMDKGVEFVNIITHTDEVTQKYYPDAWAKVCDARSARENKGAGWAFMRATLVKFVLAKSNFGLHFYAEVPKRGQVSVCPVSLEKTPAFLWPKKENKAELVGLSSGESKGVFSTFNLRTDESACLPRDGISVAA